MRTLRNQLIPLLEDARKQHHISIPHIRAQAALLHLATRLLPNPSQTTPHPTTQLIAKTLTHSNMHRHILLIRCPDQAFYLDAIKGYLILQDIQPIAQQTIVLSMQKDAETDTITLHQPEHHSPNNFMFIALHLSATLVQDCSRVIQDMVAILHAVELSIADFPAMSQQLSRIAQILQTQAPHAADLLAWMNDGRYLLFGMQHFITKENQLHPSNKRLGLMRQHATLESIIPQFRPHLQHPSIPQEAGMAWLHITASQHHIYSTTRVELLQISWKNEHDQWEALLLLGHFSRSARHANASQTPGMIPIWQRISINPLLQHSAFYMREIRTLFDRMPKSLLASLPSEDWLTPLRQVVDLTVPTHMVISRLTPQQGDMEYLFLTMQSRRFGPNIMHHIISSIESFGLTTHSQDSFGIGPYRIILVTLQAKAVWPSMEKLRKQLQSCIIFWKDHARHHLLRHPHTLNIPEALREIEDIPRLYQEIFPPETFLQHYKLRQLMEQQPHIHVLIQSAAVGVEVQVLSHQPIPLGKLINHIQDFGLTATQEADVDLGHNGQSIHISRIQCSSPPHFHPEGFTRLQVALQHVLNDEADHDPINALLTLSGLDIRQIAVLITLRNHLIQLIPDAGMTSLSHLLKAYPKVTHALYQMFEAKHRPAMPVSYQPQSQLHFDNAIAEVSSLSDDRWFRAFANLIQATLRTNAYVRAVHDPVCIKVESQKLEFAPHPRPFREIFVHGVHVEGVHLRAGPIARGGIRYSDRPHDFRTEVLELVSTQVVKNGQIVPTGSKGGFVVHGGSSPDFVLQQYRTFIRALLSLTDNLVHNNIVPPKGILIPHADRDDPYLVVAADKGTARFSDDANSESEIAHFWLDDAFASGGRYGYDHKAFGITARGAWSCAAHHFHKLNKDAYHDTLTAVGIGDMGGDVFGNGMLINPNLQLLAAFNHRHIFLDPNPNPSTAFAERQRLFKNTLGWGDYQIAHISQGGGVFERSAKKITITPEVQKALAITTDHLSGEALIQAILTASVEMLYNGGIGTYVKAEHESHAQVRDPANIAVRVDAKQLRCQVVCEGGNLGFTQRARIEYAQHGGHIFTDAIDNAAGVNMSDHEVNLKILLSDPTLTEMNRNKRNRLLHQMGEDICQQCLHDNQTQGEALSLAHMDAHIHSHRLLQLRNTLLTSGRLDRRIDPGFNDTDPLLLLPQLAVLLGHEKNRIHDALDQEKYDTWSSFSAAMLEHYFPTRLRKKFHTAIHQHPLKAGITHTQITNHLINHVGLTSVHHLQSQLNHTTGEICEALLLAEKWMGIGDFRVTLKASGLPAQTQHVMLNQSQHAIMHFAEELLRLFQIRELTPAWMQQQARGMHRFQQAWLKQYEAITPTVQLASIQHLAQLAPACYLSHLQAQPLQTSLHTMTAILNLLPFSPLEQALATAQWQDAEAHLLRRECFHRLTQLKVRAAQQLLAQSGEKQRDLTLKQWQTDSRWAILEQFRQEKSDDPQPIHLMLMLAHLEGLIIPT